MVVNGTKDPLVPYEGGHVQVFRSKRGAIFSTDETIERWRVFNGCKAEPFEMWLPDEDPRDGTRTEVRWWSGCAGQAEVCLYRVVGGGHTWPGGLQYLSKALIGNVSRDYDLVPLIFDFFARHKRAASGDTSGSDPEVNSLRR